MILPLGTDRPLKRPTVVTFVLIALNALVFIGEIVSGGRGGGGGDLRQLALDPEAIRWWGFLSYQFLHADVLHIAGNMLFLWCFGPSVEDRLGRWWFVGFYLLGGSAAGGLHAAFSSHPVIGASGAIAAVTGAFLVLFPRTHVKVFMLFFLIGIFQIPAAWFLGASIAWDILFNSRGDSGVAVGAHIGGYLFGAGVSFGLLGSGLLKREPYDLFSIAKQAHRRRVFKGEVSKGRAAWSNEHGLQHHSRRESDAAPADAPQRAELFSAIETGNVETMASAYRALLGIASQRGLPRDTLLDLANRLYGGGEKDLAASAYQSFLARHAKDVEAPLVRVMLALLCARHLNDPVRAKSLIAEAKAGRLTSDQRELAEQLLSELG